MAEAQRRSNPRKRLLVDFELVVTVVVAAVSVTVTDGDCVTIVGALTDSEAEEEEALLGADEEEVVEEGEALLGAEDDSDPVSEMHSPTQ